MERWFSPASQTGSTGSSTNSSSDGTWPGMGAAIHGVSRQVPPGQSPLAALQAPEHRQQARQPSSSLVYHSSRLGAGGSDSGQQGQPLNAAAAVRSTQFSGSGSASSSGSGALPTWKARLRDASIGRPGSPATGVVGLIPGPAVSPPGTPGAIHVDVVQLPHLTSSHGASVQQADARTCEAAQQQGPQKQQPRRQRE